MTSTPPTISAITDISANIFALLILILIIVLSAQKRAPALRDDAPQVVDLDRSMGGIERSPLSSEDMFDLLYERNKTTPSVKVDLLIRGIDITFDSRTERFNSVETAIVRLRQIIASSRFSAGLYVFSHRFYVGLTEKLQALGWSWRELSVPQALRDLRLESNGQGWSAGFSELIAHPVDRAQFRTELARLLQSSANDDTAAERWNSGGGTLRDQLATIAANLARWLQTAFNVLAVIGGLVFVGWVEMRSSRMGRSS